MQLISNLQGFLIWNFYWEEFRPVNGFPMPVILERLQGEFNFANAGQSAVAQQSNLVTPHLANGRAIIDDKSVTVNSIEFQSNRLIVSCGTTDDACRVAKKTIDLMVEEFSYREISSERSQTFQNTAVVDLGIDLEETLGKWSKVQKFFTEQPDKDASTLTPFSLRFARENYLPEDMFTFEKRVPRPENTNWIFSQAPLSTQDHHRLLEMIGEIFTR